MEVPTRHALATVMEKNPSQEGKRRAVEALLETLPEDVQEKILSDLESYPEYGAVSAIHVPPVRSKASYDA